MDLTMLLQNGYGDPLALVPLFRQLLSSLNYRTVNYMPFLGLQPNFDQSRHTQEPPVSSSDWMHQDN